MKPKGCTHGKTWEQDCLECEVVFLRQTIASFESMVIKARERLVEIEREVAASPEAPK